MHLFFKNMQQPKMMVHLLILAPISQQRNLLFVVKPMSLDLVARRVFTLIWYGGLMYTEANTCAWQYKISYKSVQVSYSLT